MRKPQRPLRFARTLAGFGLLGVATLGAVNSWASMYESALAHLGGVHLPVVRGVSVAAATVPLLLDMLIVVASLRYVVGVKEQRPVAGWRVAAHAAIAGTMIMNALSAHRPSDIPWHVIAPAVLSLVVELTARDILGQLREVRRVDADRIPLRLWLSAPAESVRTSWRMARTGERSAQAARLASDGCAAACDALRMTLPGPAHWTTRRRITRRLWAGTIDPVDVFAACGWTTPPAEPGLAQVSPDAVLRAALGRLTGPAQEVTGSPVGPAQELAQPVEVSQPNEPAQPVTMQVTAPHPATERPKTAVSQDALARVLTAVRSGQPMTKKEIVAAAGVGRSTVTRAVDHLIELGQLISAVDPDRPTLPYYSLVQQEAAR